MKFKSILIAYTVFVSASAIAADWTPVFKKFENGCADSKLLQHIVYKSIWTERGTTPDTFVRKSALKGSYANVVAPYQHDMLAAKSKLYNNGEQYIEVTIPLKNATYYGLPLKAFTVYSGTASGLAGRTLVFGQLNATQLQKLKSINFKADAEQEFKAFISTDKQKQTTLVCDVSM